MTDHRIAPPDHAATAAMFGQLLGLDPALIPAAVIDAMVRAEDALLALELASDKEAARCELKQATASLAAILSTRGPA